jgi:lipopolysaccharide transport system permease protein
VPPSPREPILVSPGQGWIGFGLGELWQYRNLGYFLAWRDLKVRYKQTAFGAAWALLQPIMLMAVFTVFLGRIEGLAPPGVPYPLFALAGLVPWTLFSQSLIGASNSLVNSQNLVSKVYFPRLLLPLAGVASYLVDFAVALVVLLGATLLTGRGLGPSVLLLPLLAVLVVVIALSVGIWLSAINARYRDVKVVVPFLVQVWLFASPVVYSGDLIPQEWRALYLLNPMAGVLEGFRWALLGGPLPTTPILASAMMTAVVAVAGLVYFRRVEQTMADTI